MGGLRKGTTVLAVLACLLQLASVASPGWMIFIKGNVEEHKSLFYRLTCNTLMDDRTCSVKSFHDLHSKTRSKMEKAQISRGVIALQDFEYHTLVCKQVLIVVASALTVFMVVSQICQWVKKKTYTRLMVLSVATAATSAGIVLAVAFNDIVNVIHQMNLLDLDSDRDHTYVGFPYCLAMLLGSVGLLFISIGTISMQLYTPKVKGKKVPLPVDDEISTPYVAPITKLDDMPKPTLENSKTSYDVPKISNDKPKSTNPHVTTITYTKGCDNPVFSEKL